MPSLLRLALLATTCALLLACGSGERADDAGERSNTATTQVIQLDGSSTVYPISEAIAEEFQLQNQGRLRVTVGVSGTGGGFKKFCRGELDIANASRPIQRSEMDDCKAAGVRYYELPIAYDALTVVVHPSNDFLTEASVEQLRRIWAPESQGQITRWNQVEPSWPDAEIKLFGAGSDSGTFDYFTEVIVGKAKASRGDFTASEDDNTLVQGVAQDRFAMGYFGYAYFAENRDKLKAVAIRPSADAAAVSPSDESVIDGSYVPLARPMFVYLNAASYERPEVKQFIEFYFDNVDELAREVRYVPLPESAYAGVRQHLQDGRLGTVFGGEAATSITIEDLLRRDAGL